MEWPCSVSASADPTSCEKVARLMKSGCAECKFHKYAERKPNSFLARLWKWHTGWCPGWKAYQRELSQSGEPPKA